MIFKKFLVNVHFKKTVLQTVMPATKKKILKKNKTKKTNNNKTKNKQKQKQKTN